MPSSAEQNVGVAVAEDHVVAGAAEYLVDAVAAVKLVVAFVTEHGVERATAGEDAIIAGTAGDEVVVLVVEDEVVALAAKQVVVALAALDRVVASITIDRVVAEAADDEVVAFIAGDDDVAVAGRHRLAVDVKNRMAREVEVVVDVAVRINVRERRAVELVACILADEDLAVEMGEPGVLRNQIGELVLDDLVAEVGSHRRAEQVVETVAVLLALGEVEDDVAEGGAQRAVEQRPLGEAADPQVDVPEALVGAGETPLAVNKRRVTFHEGDGVVVAWVGQWKGIARSVDI